MALNLPNIVDVLDRAFSHFDPDLCSDMVMALGNTGSGKSTLLGAMILGPKSLHMTKEYKQSQSSKSS